MNYIKNMAISIGIGLGTMIILLLLTTILSYFNVLGDKLTNIFKIIIPIITLLTSGILIGKNSHKKGWLEGLKIGVILLVMMIIINYLVYNALSLKTSIYYLILIMSAIFGGMIGINKNKELDQK